VLNAAYRLFDPEHGRRDTDYRQQYAEASGHPDTPVVFVTWYDAWVLSRWARWNGRSCRLPLEHEWEYAAKGGTPWDWNYWWGDELDPSRCNGPGSIGRTNAPDEAHANPFGLCDVLGNVWEWCGDTWSGTESSSDEPAPSLRVLRGGSWDYFPADVRTTARLVHLPTMAMRDVGFRLAR